MIITQSPNIIYIHSKSNLPFKIKNMDSLQNATHTKVNK